MYDDCWIKSKWMNDTNDAEDEREQRRRAQSSDHSLCSDTKMMQDWVRNWSHTEIPRGNWGDDVLGCSTARK